MTAGNQRSHAGVSFHGPPTWGYGGPSQKRYRYVPVKPGELKEIHGQCTEPIDGGTD
jgi:hypothetical protein